MRGVGGWRKGGARENSCGKGGIIGVWEEGREGGGKEKGSVGGRE